jgi:protein-tyrosine kinase
MTDKTSNKHTVSIDFDAFEGAAMHADAKTKSGINEEFRSVKRQILDHAFTEDHPVRNRVMFTSVSGNEGKTFAAVNLARSVSLEKDKRALLVDVDVLGSGVRISDATDPHTAQGLIDYLDNDNIDIPDIMCDTDIERLKVIPMGTHHTLANELLSGNDMAFLMSEFQDRYDDRLVIFDAPPILGVNETRALAGKMDQIVVLVEEGHTRVKDLLEVQRCLPKHVKVHYLMNKTLSKSVWRASEVGEHDEFTELDSALTGSQR